MNVSFNTWFEPKAVYTIDRLQVVGSIVTAVKVKRVVTDFMQADAFACRRSIGDQDGASRSFVKTANPVLSGVSTFLFASRNCPVQRDRVKIGEHLLHFEDRVGKYGPDNAFVTIARKRPRERRDFAHLLRRAFFDYFVNNPGTDKTKILRLGHGLQRRNRVNRQLQQGHDGTPGAVHIDAPLIL